jgi:hypothetical protein
VITAQYNNTRQDASLTENVFTTSNVASTFGATKVQFRVDATHLPGTAGQFVNNPVYAQPLYVTNVSNINSQTNGPYDMLFIAALNGEVYAYGTDNLSNTNPAPTPLWKRDDTNTATGTLGLAHDCDAPGLPGASGLAGTPTTGYAGGALAITYNPTESPTAAVVWAAAAPYPNPTTSHCSQRTGLGCFGYLLAYSLDASGNLSSSQIWPSTLPATPDFAPAPYAIPTAANGTVYVPAYALCSTYVGGNCTNYLQSGVQVYGF